MRTLLSPRWIGLHLLLVLVVVVCSAGTYWQALRSVEPDREVITNPAEDLDDATPLDDLVEPGAYLHPDLYANTAVEVSGRYDADAQLLVPRALDGVRGYDVILPLVTDDGAAVTVNRGWTEDGSDVPDAPDGRVTVTGWILPPDAAPDGIVPVDTPDGQVERIASAVLVNEWDYRLYEGYVALPEGDPATASLRPLPPPEPPTEITVNWRSLSYAVQWAMFGVSAIAFWVVRARRDVAEARSRRERASETEGGTPQAVGAGS
ncbi:SURF1 family protein [Nocardiopsis sp. FIRDI 009]|uniref:SURF1 family protein n=1 Tax=Nocardiopsis sp. FIRDI 009 TaxID=714197 RepID=UPI000E21D3DE|nr:SURF1 family protein [Nocardiopsis sp. FIRDI 009]